MTTEEINFVLERFDKTEPKLQRAIVARLVLDNARMDVAIHLALQELRDKRGYFPKARIENAEETLTTCLAEIEKEKGGA